MNSKQKSKYVQLKETQGLQWGQQKDREPAVIWEDPYLGSKRNRLIRASYITPVTGS